MHGGPPLFHDSGGQWQDQDQTQDQDQDQDQAGGQGVQIRFIVFFLELWPGTENTVAKEWNLECSGQPWSGSGVLHKRRGLHWPWPGRWYAC